MACLAGEMLGVKLSSPLLLAPGQYTTTGSMISSCAKTIAENGWGGVVTKTYFPNSDLLSRPYLWSSPQYRGLAMQNTGPNMQHFCDEEKVRLSESIKVAHAYGLAVIVSIMGSSFDQWKYLTEEIQQCKADVLELNLSCPAAVNSIEANRHGGYQAGQQPEIVAQVTEVVSQNASIPISAKLSPNTADITVFAKACMENGAQGVTAINTLQGIIGVDVETGVPLCSDIEKRAFKAGISGPVIKPVGLRMVADIAQSIPGIAISATGGICNWRDAVEYLMLGAQNVQVCTAVMMRGFSVGKEILDGLQDFMCRKGYQSLSDFRGMALPYLTTVSKACPSAKASISQERCIRCGKCLTACSCAAFQAILKNDTAYRVDQARCDGCGLCTVVCPQEAITIGGWHENVVEKRNDCQCRRLVSRRCVN